MPTIDLSSEDILQITAALHSQTEISRRDVYRTGDRVSRRNHKIRVAKLEQLTKRLFAAVEGNLRDNAPSHHRTDRGNSKERGF